MCYNKLMRIKENTTNWNASNVLRKLKQVPDKVKHTSKKDRTKWCKGKVGRVHDYEYSVPKNDRYKDRLMLICSVCGKQDYHDTLYWCDVCEDYGKSYHWHNS